MNTRWIILFSFFYLLLLINQAEVQDYNQTSPVGKRRFPLERIVQHQDPAQKTAPPANGYLSGPVGREVRQKEREDPNLEANEWMY
ncbi:hypothetical protein pdam_00024412 [Pocillopora damicornis]|uniref:Uncharacterized protein n=1 Tax=Pocillopora damicornis TaxID=46731 RepID=A0A3M6UZV9_POCDA|nr:hypothetical protein pdam_00024412 [Pocillopora damicornis]